MNSEHPVLTSTVMFTSCAKHAPLEEHEKVEQDGNVILMEKQPQHGGTVASQGDTETTFMYTNTSSLANECDKDQQRLCEESRQPSDSDNASSASSYTCRSIRWSCVENKLFDRHNQSQQLLSAYRRLVNRSDRPHQMQRQEIVLITGPSGTGKSSLARSIEPQTRREGRPAWLFGKCEKQFQEREPFAPIVQAFTHWLETVVDDRNIHEDGDAAWTIRRIELAFLTLQDDQLRLVALFDIVPAFFKLLSYSRFVPTDDEDPEGCMIGRARNTNGASPGAAALCQFLKAFCSKEHPMVLLLDDWQWLDSGSLHIISQLASMKDLEGLMLIGTCRGDEMTVTDDLCVMLRGLEENNVIVTDIQVGNLPQSAVQELIHELLDVGDDQDFARLAATTYRATNGNPFLVVQFLRAIAYHGVLYYTAESCVWQWDESFIETNLSYFDSSEMIETTLRFLVQNSDSVKEVLKVSSCLGTEFDFELLEAASGLQHAVLSDAIEMLASRGLFDEEQSTLGSTIRWSHDRFLHAAASLVPEHEKDAFSVNIASRLLVYDDLLDKHTFLVAALLYIGAETFLETKEHRLSAAALFNLAGNKTARLSSFAEAASYFRKGIGLLPSECWQNNDAYALCLHLYNSCAEMECCLGNHAQVDQVANVIQMNARCLRDKLQSYETAIYSLCARNDHDNALDVAFSIMEELGEPIPKTVSIFRVLRTLLTVKLQLRRWAVDDILNLRPLRHWKKLAAMRIIHIILPTIMRCKPDHLVVIIAKYIDVTLKDGISPLAALAFAALGMVMCYPLGMVQDGLRYEEIGYRVFQKFNCPSDLLCRIYVLRYGYVGPWRMSVKECIPRLLIGAQKGLQTGDFEIAFAGMFDYSVNGLFTGFSLESHCTKMIQIKDQFASLGQRACMYQFLSIIQLAKNLVGNASDVRVLVGPDFDVENVIQNAIASGNQSIRAYALVCQMFLAIFLGDYHRAISIGRMLQRSQTPFFTAFVVQYLTFLSGLSEVIEARISRKRSGIKAGRRAIKRIQQMTKRAPEEWVGRIAMITAEICAVRGERDEALRHWRCAISCANKNGFVHEEALSVERAGLAFMEWKRPLEAWNYCQEAQMMYTKWGFAEETLWNCKRYLFGDNDSIAHRTRFDLEQSTTLTT